jgi:carbon storage regulator|tara:strand:- start:372 stop:551 length:180 start_codon:yes stop_codon:yes gene_type:complete
MLVLSRKKDESVIIDGNIQVTIIEVRGDKVRLGIKAPREIPVHREEIAEKVKAANNSKE